MRPQVTGYQFYIDTDSMTGDGTAWNPLRVNAITANVNPQVTGVAGATPGQVLVDTSSTPYLAYVYTGPAPTDWSAIGIANTSHYSSQSYLWEDDWFLQAQLSQGGGWNGAVIGALPYSLVLVGVNTSIAQVTGTQRLGVCELLTGTTNAGIAAVNTQATLAFDAGTFDEISYEFVGGLQALDDGIDSFSVSIGLIGNAPGYGVYFVYDPTNSTGFNAALSVNWLCFTEEAGVWSVIDSGVAPGAVIFPNTNVVRLKCLYQSALKAGTATPVATFLINGVQVAQTNANLPSHSLAGAVFINKSAGVNPRGLYIDYTALGCILSTPRLP